MGRGLLVVDLDLVREEEELLVRATLHNRGSQDVDDWCLKFDLPKAIRARSETILSSQIGSHVTLRSTTDVLPAGGSVVLSFSTALSSIQRLTDLPNGLYITAQLKGETVHLPAVLGDHNLLALTGTQSELLRPDYGRVTPTATATATDTNAPGDRPATQDSIEATHSEAQTSDRAGGDDATGHDTAATTRSAATPASDNTISVNSADGAPSSGDTRDPDATGVLPRPKQSTWHDARTTCTQSLSYEACPEATSAIDWLGAHLTLEMTPQNGGVLQCTVDSDLPAEGYRLQITAAQILITAPDEAGFFYASVSLDQLADRDSGSALSWPIVTIEDSPRFGYRGFMLDCARHFHSKQTVLRMLDLMARFKLNHFHWHLTDDEGWRVEIQAYPELTERGAWRGEGEVLQPQFGTGPGRYGGYYTRQDVQDVVEYARALQITVIPEIDIPGHSRAAIKSLPHLLAEEADQSQYSGAQMYTDNVLNPALPGTYTFLHNVLSEICEMFPGPYIHLGADEVPEGVWEASPACDEFKATHGYETAHQLQGHLFRDLQTYLVDRGKKLMGWEEAVRGDKLDHTATVNAWTGVPVAAELANAGYHVVACAAPFAYLDMAWDASVHAPGFYWAGTCDLEGSYIYEPLSPELTVEGADRIIGMQAVIWSELISRPEQLEYMLFPRLLALAETAWTQARDKDWADFQRRLPRQMAQLDRDGINHRSLQDTI